MCGIAGIVHLDGRGVDRAELEAMARTLVHRGPDDEGFYVSPCGSVGLAFRRLSIIDLSGGHQPMSNETGDVWVAFNGEIYNYASLRRELADLGHELASDSDTETIIHGYEQWGPDGVSRLRGMFAYAIWDERKRRLVIARDRLGKKPVYLYCDGRRIVFGSELKALLAVPWVPRDLDLIALGQYLRFGYIPAPQSIYQGIRKLPPAHLMVATAEVQRVTRYWDIPAAAPQAYRDLDEAVEDIDTLLREAVAMRLHADVPVGAFLSGGIDSSLVVAMMTRASTRRVRTFSIGFGDQLFDELPWANQVAQHLGTDHHVEVLHPDVESTFITLVRHFDEPFADSSMIPTYLVSSAARRHVTVALSGDGGDEGFAGYDHYRAFLWARAAAACPGMPRAAGIAASLLPTAMKGENLIERIASGRSLFDCYASTMSICSMRTLQRLVLPDLGPMILEGPRQAAREIYRGAEWNDYDPVQAAQRIDLTRGYLHGDILFKVDMSSMANSLEVRSPLLDHVVIERAVTLPQAFKMNRTAGKLVLRRLAERYLPRSIVERKKHGFSIPLGSWLRGPLAPLVREHLLDRRAELYELFDRRAMTTLVNRHLDGHVDRGTLIFTMLTLELWLRGSRSPASTSALAFARAG